MNRVYQIIEEMRTRSDVGIADGTESWFLSITKGCDLICEVTVPHSRLEWFASVRSRRDRKELWSDWMDYAGYNDQPREELEAEMATDILAFIDRVSMAEPLLPLKIFEERS
jgi:hypothetical protein